MRMPIGSTAVSTSGGSVELVGRRGDAWQPIAGTDMPLDAAIALLDDEPPAGVDPALADDAPSDSANHGRFDPGETIMWRYARVVEMARVVRDDERGLVVWIPSGSARLDAVPADGRGTRDVPLAERFRVPWVMKETTWTGPGIVRIAPADRLWSVWFFRRADGTPDGAYVKLELPHRRSVDGVFSRDLVLDLWIDAEHAGAEDIWLKDADELVAAVEQGRFTSEQADAVRILADHAGREFIAAGAWPLDDGWDCWMPDAAMDAPIPLPDNASVQASRTRSGSTSIEG